MNSTKGDYMEKTIVTVMMVSMMVLAGYTINTLNGTYEAVNKTVHLFVK